MINKHTVDYHPSPLRLTSTIHPLIILWTREGFTDPSKYWRKNENVELKYKMLSFFSKPYLTIIGKILKFILFRLLENAFVSQKIESIHFYSWPPPPLPAKLSTRFLSYYNSPRQNFLKIVRGKGGGNYERCEEVTKIKLLRVLVTSFDKSHHLFTLYIFGYCFAVP